MDGRFVVACWSADLHLRIASRHRVVLGSVICLLGAAVGAAAATAGLDCSRSGGLARWLASVGR
jgi:hypothetical protein